MFPISYLIKKNMLKIVYVLCLLVMYSVAFKRLITKNIFISSKMSLYATEESIHHLINNKIKKDVDKVVDTIKLDELKPNNKVVICR